jgi:hypothetical protein
MQLERIKKILPQAQKEVMPQDIEKAAPVKEPGETEDALPLEEAETPITE